MAIRPINGHVLLKPLEAEEQTAGGIYLPDSARGGLQEGEIVAAAEDATEEVAIGDRVVYKDLSGTEITSGGEDYLVLSSEDLLAKYIAVDRIPE